MADIRLYITQVHGVEVFDDRSVNVNAVCEVRGPVKIQMREDEFRWLHAQMTDIIRPWQKEEERGR